MYISVNRCEFGQDPAKTTVAEVMDEFGIIVHPIVTVEDIYEYLKESGKYSDVLSGMVEYMAKYCVL